MQWIPRFFLSFTVLTSLVGSFSVQADIRTPEEAVNIAGRQRMLSQRMVKAWLLIGQDVATERARRQLDEAMALFEEQLSDLEVYISQRKLRSAVHKTRALWNRFRTALLNPPDQKAAAALIEEGEKLLQSANQVVSELEQAPKGDAQRLKIVNLSGRQRMLSQRIALYYSALAWNAGDSARNRSRLEKAVSMYESSLKVLLQSSFNTPDIQNILTRVSDHWSFSKAGFQLMDHQSFVPFVIQSTTESMLKRMETVTGLYAGQHHLDS